MKSYRMIAALLGVLILTACTSAKTIPTSPPQPSSTRVVPTQPPATATLPAVAAADTPLPPTATLVPPTATLVPPTATPVPPTNTPAPSDTPGVPALPPEAQVVEFEAEDGQALKGTYYPAAVNPAPLVVLMHWAGGDQYDWIEIAYWLQNRSLGGNTPNPQNLTWLDSSWFPPMLEGNSFAVFTFTFRNCEGGCRTFEREKWLLDAQAAMLKASQLEGVDPQRIIAMGASIGADGAPDGCFWLNQQHPNSCLGALSLSPGHYLTVDYADAVQHLENEQPSKPAWCLFATQDVEAAPACNAAAGDHYQKFEYAGNPHGMLLLQPDLDPNPMLLILDFLKLTFGP